MERSVPDYDDVRHLLVAIFLAFRECSKGEDLLLGFQEEWDASLRRTSIH